MFLCVSGQSRVKLFLSRRIILYWFQCFSDRPLHINWLFLLKHPQREFRYSETESFQRSFGVIILGSCLFAVDTIPLKKISYGRVDFLKRSSWTSPQLLRNAAVLIIVWVLPFWGKIEGCFGIFGRDEWTLTDTSNSFSVARAPFDSEKQTGFSPATVWLESLK